MFYGETVNQINTYFHYPLFTDEDGVVDYYRVIAILSKLRWYDWSQRISELVEGINNWDLDHDGKFHTPQEVARAAFIVTDPWSPFYLGRENRWGYKG